MRRLVGLGFEISAAAALVTVLLACSKDSGDGTGGSNTLPVSAVNPGFGATAGTGAQAPGTVGGVTPNTGLPGSSGAIPQTTNPNAPGTTPGIGTGAAGAGSTPATPGATGMPMPCNVQGVVASNCQSCHAATPIGGAPMPLLTYDDFHKPAKTMPTLKVFELAKMRINNTMKPMPPGGQFVAATDFATLDGWLGQMAPAGTAAADKSCMVAAPPLATGGPGTGDGTTGPITAGPGETCYEFRNHGSTTSVDDTKFSIPMGEQYEQFYFQVPWQAGVVATRYGTKYDNQQVLHHWLMFTTNESYNPGYHETRALPTVSGTNASLLAGWAVGGTNLAPPNDVGFELPASGLINLQWHFYNYTDKTQQDGSAVQVCTVPAAMRAHTATIAWIGTEDLGGNKWLLGPGMPPHQMSVYSGTCNPSRKGMNATDPIHIIAFWPHMHQLGVRMRALVNHKGGMQGDPVFDKPFDFNHQIHYMQNYDLQPGDTMTAECTFNNTTDNGVPFGESSDTEMCYNFTMAWPAHALENGVSSLIGASNTCW